MYDIATIQANDSYLVSTTIHPSGGCCADPFAPAQVTRCLGCGQTFDTWKDYCRHVVEEWDEPKEARNI